MKEEQNTFESIGLTPEQISQFIAKSRRAKVPVGAEDAWRYRISLKDAGIPLVSADEPLGNYLSGEAEACLVESNKTLAALGFPNADRLYNRDPRKVAKLLEDTGWTKAELEEARQEGLIALEKNPKVIGEVLELIKGMYTKNRPLQYWQDERIAHLQDLANLLKDYKERRIVSISDQGKADLVFELADRISLLPKQQIGEKTSKIKAQEDRVVELIAAFYARIDSRVFRDQVDDAEIVMGPGWRDEVLHAKAGFINAHERVTEKRQVSTALKA